MFSKYIDTFIPRYFRPLDADQGGLSASNSLMDHSGSDFQQAIAQALKDFFEYFPEITVTEIEIEYSSKQQGFIVEVEGVDVDNLYKLKLDVATKELISREIKTLNNYQADGIKLRREGMDLSTITKSFDEIYATAKNAVPELIEESIREIELSREGNYHEWEFEIKANNQEIEIEIDAETGKILDIEYD